MNHFAMFYNNFRVFCPTSYKPRFFHLSFYLLNCASNKSGAFLEVVTGLYLLLSINL